MRPLFSKCQKYPILNTWYSDTCKSYLSLNKRWVIFATQWKAKGLGIREFRFCRFWVSYAARCVWRGKRRYVRGSLTGSCVGWCFSADYQMIFGWDCRKLHVRMWRLDGCGGLGSELFFERWNWRMGAELFYELLNFRVLFCDHAKAQRGRVSILWEASRRGYSEYAKITGCFASPGAHREQAQFLR